jgi:hypothetical protein
MRYLLDTNMVSDLVRNPQGKVAARLAHIGEESVCTVSSWPPDYATELPGRAPPVCWLSY